MGMHTTVNFNHSIYGTISPSQSIYLHFFLELYFAIILLGDSINQAWKMIDAALIHDTHRQYPKCRRLHDGEWACMHQWSDRQFN